jgi:hypothetical protein
MNKSEIIYNGEVVSHSNNASYWVLLEDGRKIEAVITRQPIGCIFKFRPSMKVKVVFLPSPKMPKIIEILNPN